MNDFEITKRIRGAPGNKALSRDYLLYQHHPLRKPIGGVLVDSHEHVSLKENSKNMTGMTILCPFLVSSVGGVF